MKVLIRSLGVKVFSVLFISFFMVIAETEENEWRFNALYITNFARYIKWPDSASQKIIITVLGNDPVFYELTKISKLIRNEKNLIIKSETEPGKIHNTDIIFIPANRSEDLQKVVQQFDRKPVLIVTNKKGLISQGACINLNNLYWKLRYEISVKNLKSHNLIADPILFNLGKVFD